MHTCNLPLSGDVHERVKANIVRIYEPKLERNEEILGTLWIPDGSQA
jgi:hypothetical protein